MSAVCVAALLVIAACAGDDASNDDEPPPGTDPAAEEATADEATQGDDSDAAAAWSTTSPEDAGMDAELVDEILASAEAGDSDCVLIARDGQIVAQEHFGERDPDEPREVFSATKSLTAVLVGIAIDDGDLELDERAADHIGEWQGTESEEVTVRNLLSNDSGRYWDFETDYTQMPPSPDNTQFAIELDQQHPPGEVWIYNNAAIQTLDAVLESATGQHVADFAEERVLEPLGMDDSYMRTDNSDSTLTYMGLQTTCSDFVRLGQLVLDGGAAPDGTQVVSSEFLDEAMSPSTDLTSAYGYLWWLNRPGPIADAMVATTGETAGDAEEGQINDDIPEDVIWASGLFDQILAVYPSSGVIGVRIGDDPPGESGFNRNAFSTALHEAVLD